MFKNKYYFQKYRKNKYSYSNNDTGKNNKPNQVESVVIYKVFKL
jgi:hypothetical protein